MNDLVAQWSDYRFTTGTLLSAIALLVSLAAVMAVSVRFTLPAFRRDTTSCAAGPEALTDLDSVFVWMQLRGARTASLVLAAGMRGREGQAMTVQIPTDSVATVWVETTDARGNRSCPSNYVGVNLTVGVPPFVRANAPDSEWFDVTGRRITAPRAPGVYFLRRGRGHVRSVVVIR